MTNQEFKSINTLSGLIRASLADLRTVEKIENIKIKPNIAFYEMQGKTCILCVAGAVMYSGLHPINNHIDLKIGLFPSDYEDKIESRLRAIDHLRSGNVSSAGNYIYLNNPEDIYNYDRSMPRYSPFPSEFYTEQYQLADELEAAGY